MTRHRFSLPQAVLLLGTLVLPQAALWGQPAPPAPPSAPDAVSPKPPRPPRAEVSPRPAAAPRAAVAPRSPRSPVSPRTPVAPRPPRAPRHWGGYLGVELVDLTPDLRQHFGAPREVGVMIGRVEPGSPAARAGLEVADIVVGIGAEPVYDSWGLSSEVVSREDGEALDLEIVRDRRELRVSARLERRDREAVDVGRWIFPRVPFPESLTPPPGAGVPLPEMGPALERLGKLLESSDFDERLRAAQLKIDSEVEERMRELEARLKDLEKRLQEGERRN
jgi:hypothetical protein